MLNLPKPGEWHRRPSVDDRHPGAGGRRLTRANTRSAQGCAERAGPERRLGTHESGQPSNAHSGVCESRRFVANPGAI